MCIGCIPARQERYRVRTVTAVTERVQPLARTASTTAATAAASTREASASS